MWKLIWTNVFNSSKSISPVELLIQFWMSPTKKIFFFENPPKIAARIEAIHSRMCWIPSFKRWKFSRGISVNKYKNTKAAPWGARARKRPALSIRESVKSGGPLLPGRRFEFRPIGTAGTERFLPSFLLTFFKITSHSSNFTLKKKIFLIFPTLKLHAFKRHHDEFLHKLQMLIVVQWFQWIHLKSK